MKKIVLLAMLVMCLGLAWAQKRVGQFSFIPRVGLNLSNLGDMDIYYVSGKNADGKLNSRIRPDFMLGADVEYQAMKPLGISLGVYYSRQGCRWADYSDQYTADNNKTHIVESWQDQAVTLQYINVPVTAKLYVNEFLAFHAGLQGGFALDGKKSFVRSVLTEPESGSKTFTSEKYDDKMRELNPVVWSIPIGASVEYDKVIVDFRYCIPLSRFSNEQLIPSGYYSEGRNRVWTISVGYRL